MQLQRLYGGDRLAVIDFVAMGNVDRNHGALHRRRKCDRTGLVSRSARLNSYRLDLRINRSVFTNGRRSFDLFIDVANVYNRKNVRGYEDFQFVEGDQGTSLQYAEDTWLPILPSFGITWRF